MLVGLAAIAAGVVVRFSGLETRTFWEDEAFSALRISGHTYAEMTALFDGRIHQAAQIAVLQEHRRGLGATIGSVLAEEPQRGLVYYVAASLWSSAFGTSIAAERAFSALIGTVGIALGFLLGRRATRRPLGGVVLAALIALSPLQVAYSQQVREYALFADSILLAAWLLLRALESPTASRWAVFCFASIVGLYVEPLFVPVLLAAAIVVAFERPLERAKIAGFALSAAAALASFLPLAVINLRAAAQTSLGVSWAATLYAPQAYAIKWLFNVGVTFFDAELANRWWAIALFPLLAIVACAIAYAVRSARRGDRSARLALALLACTSLPLIAADVVKHAHYEAVTRYQIATWIGLELAVALALTAALLSGDARLHRGGAIASIFILACSATSLFVDRPYALWWENNQTLDSAAIVAAVPSHPTPTIIAQRSVAVDVLVLGRYLAPHDRLLLEPKVLYARDQPFYLFLPDAMMKGFLTAAEICFHHDRGPCRGRANGKIVNVSPRVSSAVPSLARDARLDDPKNALWTWEPHR